MKNFLKSLFFILIVCLIFNVITQFLWLDKNSIYYFFKDKNAVYDVVYIGSSNAYAHFNTTLAYEKYGFTTGLISTDQQPFALVEYLMKQSRIHHKDSLYVVDIAIALFDKNIFSDADVRRTVDSMPFGKNRADAITKVLDQLEIEKSIDYYLSFGLYHNRWKNLGMSNFYRDDLYKGYLYNDGTNIIEPQVKDEEATNSIALTKENEENLKSIVEYCKDNNVNVIFVIPIRSFEEDAKNRIKTAIKIIENSGLKVINFNDIEEINIDYTRDFYNAAHMNVYGATKYTLYFGKYLKGNYNLPDHRDDKNFGGWHEEYERFKQKYKEINSANFEDLIN